MNQQRNIKVKIAWWLRWYLFGVVMMAWLTKLQPDQDRLRYWIGKAIKIKVD